MIVVRRQYDSEMEQWACALYANIRDLCRQKRLSVREMAEIMGISEARLRRVEALEPNARLMNADHLFRLCAHFGLSADGMLGLRDDFT